MTNMIKSMSLTKLDLLDIAQRSVRILEVFNVDGLVSLLLVGYQNFLFEEDIA